MRNKVFDKKLTIKKSTVASLDSAEMSDLKGGIDRSLLTACLTCNSDYPCYSHDLACA